MQGSHNFPTFGTQLFPIIAALPIFAGHADRADHYLIVVQTAGIMMIDTPEYVFAMAESLDSDDWMPGSAVMPGSLADALAMLYKRSGIADALAGDYTF